MKMKEKVKEKHEEDDVCFICFDGGSLVLCDRRGCPKAYHPACIKRDEAFFQSKAKWNCGWHICSKCQKTSHYMCYTCTYSLCKGCTKDADYVSVRGDKGFCSICFKTIMLIENKDPGNKDMPQVDFDDKLSWEYLFKIYWVVLKQKLSLTLPELMQARSPWKEPAVTKIYKGQPAGVHNIYNNGKIPISNPPSNPPMVMKSSEETKIKEPLKILNGDSLTHEKLATDKGTSSTASIAVRAPQSNLDEYAAVDVHNISLIYLRRDLMVNLFEDSNEKFHSKVTGSIVRIRVPSSDQEKDIHRLVKVIGTNKVVLPYKIGNKSLDVTLKVLNLGKQEDVSIDAISNNQDFSEEECIDLRQNIRRGLIERWTVVEIRAKAMSLQAAKFKDWVETEIMRFNQLRDQASEQGQTKEDCVERLQLLKSPEERRRRLCEAPEIHSDPKMHPNYGPEEDAVYSNGKKEDKEEVSPKTERVEDDKETSRSNTSEVQGNRAGTAGISSSTLTDQATTGPATVPVITSETSTTPLSTESTPPANESEAEKLWHYRDLNGQTQGPFSMLQLQKWSASGFFPPDMRIWASDRQDDSVLLTDALDGQLLYNISVQFKDSTKIEDLNSNTGKDHHSSGNNGRDPSKAENNTSSDNDQTQIHTSVGPATSSVGVHVTVNQTEKPQEMGKLESDLNQENWNNTTRSTAVETSSVQENHSNPSVLPGKSSGQNWRPLPLNFFPNNFESGDRNAGVDIPDLDSPAPKTSSGGWESQTAEENKQTSVCSAVPVRDTITVDLPILTLKMSNEDQNKHEAENIENKQQSLPMNFPVQESGPSWNNGTGVELGGDKLEITDKWGGYFSNTMPHDALGDSHVSSLSSKIDQLFHSPRSHPTSSWQMGFTERIEFSTLAEESVSDLLAEVDAMESQGGLPSPTSVMKCGEDLMQGPKHDYFSNMEEEFSPTIDPVKTEALTSTSNNIHLPSHSTIKTDIFDPIKGSSTTQSSTRAEVYRDSKTPTNFPSSQGKSGFDMFDTADISRKARSSKSKSSSRWDPVPHQTSIRAKAEEETRSNPNGSYVQFHAPFTMGQDLVDSVETHRPRTESMENDWLKMHQSSERSKADGRSNNRDGSSLRVPSPLNVSRKSGPDQMDVSWDPIHGNLNPAGLLGRSPQGITSPSYQGMSRGSGSTITTDHGVSPGSRGRDSQRKHGGGERLTSPRDRVSHSRDSRDSSRGGSKSSWSRQSSGSGGGGGSGYSSSRHPSRGQRVCKFYESGHCKKGALCDYFHP